MEQNYVTVTLCMHSKFISTHRLSLLLLYKQTCLVRCHAVLVHSLSFFAVIPWLAKLLMLHTTRYRNILVKLELFKPNALKLIENKVMWVFLRNVSHLWNRELGCFLLECYGMVVKFYLNVKKAQMVTVAMLCMLLVLECTLLLEI